MTSKIINQSLTRQQPYTALNSTVLQNVRNPDVLAVWVYLSSFPNEFNINSLELRNQFFYSEKKLNGILNVLVENNLIRFDRIENPETKLIVNTLVVLNGEEYELSFPALNQVKKSKSTARIRGSK
jgi:hypothetical protein